MRRSGKGSGGGYGSRPHRDVRAPKSEPKPRAMSPGAVNQFGAKVGDHTTDKRSSSGYRGEELVRGKGYTPPVGPTDNVKAVGVGGGRKIYACGGQGVQGEVNRGQSTPKRDILSEYGPEASNQSALVKSRS
jgi:hypothetical protein